MHSVTKGEDTVRFLMCLKSPATPIRTMFLYERDEPRKTERELGDKHSKKETGGKADCHHTHVVYSCCAVVPHLHTAVSLDQRDPKDLTSVSFRLFSNLKRQNEPH